jgi:hypothetical protein
MLLAPLSTPYGGGGGGDRLAGCQAGQLTLHLDPSHRRGSVEKGWSWDIHILLQGDREFCVWEVNYVVLQMFISVKLTDLPYSSIIHAAISLLFNSFREMIISSL